MMLPTQDNRLDLGRAAAWRGARGTGFWALALLAVGCLVYLPRLSVYPLWDPWEPHYTQVAWEMQERLTWNNPWYRGLDNWWSKPILMLWMLRASLAALWDANADFLNHELAARLPFALTAIAGGLLHFDWVRRLYGRTTGVLAGVVLMTAPQYLLIGRQVMADIPFLVTYAAGLGYLAVGLFAPRPAAPTDATVSTATLAWVRREHPFLLFWVLMALSVLAKGFIAPTCAVMILAGYWAATLRWRDYAELTQGRNWRRYWLIRGGIAAAAAGAAFLIAWTIPGANREQRALFQALIGGAAVAGIALGVFHDLPPMRHALRVLVRIRAAWGLALFFAVAAPWFVYMSVEHGWPFWNEFIFYHHLGRAAGTIDKPGGTFDYFVKQIGFGLFPWTAFVAGALWKFLGRSSPTRSIADRRNLFILLSAALPFLFFSLSGTKFAHYIFPVVPMLGVMLAAVLVWLGRDGEERVPLAEEGPALGPPVEAHPPLEPGRWWERIGGRGDLLVFAAIALVIFGILAHDLVLDFRHFLRLFIYYRSRPTPPHYFPFIALQLIFFPIGIAIGTLLLGRYVGRWHVGLIAAGAIVLACYLSWVTMPAMKDTYSFKPFVAAYEEFAKPGEPIAQYNDWRQPARSVIFLFRNRCVHLGNGKQAAAFLKRKGRKFILVDNNRLADLRRIARDVDVKLYVVFDGHPYGRMVSDQPNETDARRAAEHILSELPPDVHKVDADFEGKIRLIGWKTDPPAVRPGDSITVEFYYQCLKVMDRDWQIFVHGDGPNGHNSDRIHADHYPVGGIYLTTEWQEGEIIRDRFRVAVPGDYSHAWFHLWTGWYIDNQRLALQNNPPNDGEDRVRGPRISVRQD